MAIAKTVGVADVLKEVLSHIQDHIAAAFVYGSVVTSSERSTSDIDLMVIGATSLSEVAPILRKAEERLGRAVNPTVYSSAEFRRQIQQEGHFLKTVLGEEKLFVIGTQDDLAKSILRWAVRYAEEFEKRWRRYERPVGGSWRADETYIKVRGRWVYLYRAVDAKGKSVDFYLSRTRDKNAATAFFRKAMKHHDEPRTITLDGVEPSHSALRCMGMERIQLSLGKPGQDPFLSVLKQYRRARPPKSEVPTPADARLLAVLMQDA